MRTQRMTEPSPTNEELRVLRLAAERGDWNGCRAASEKLLLRLTCRRALGLARDYVMRRLFAFERHQPDVHWPREFIESIDGDPSHTKQEWPESEDDFAGPGANSFTSAVEALWKASRLIMDEQRCVSELVNALAGAIMAERSEFWGSRNPEEWMRWYSQPPDSDDMSGFKILMAAAKDPDVMRLERAGWLEVADQLEEALREG